MEVFLVPVGRGRYEMYCEPGDAVTAPDPLESTGHWRRRLARWRRDLIGGFWKVVASVEAARHGAAHRRATRQPRSLARRARDRAVCWMAEKIAEQRLLWHLPGHQQVTVWFPDDLGERHAFEHVCANLRADADRHLRWLLVDGVGLLGSFALVPIPGPNLVLYYFTFRVGGHYLSRRGARHGLAQIDWQMQPSSALTDLRRALALEHDERTRHVAEIASRLRLQHLAAFFERTAVAAP